jgi:hypothetical protein
VETRFAVLIDGEQVGAVLDKDDGVARVVLKVKQKLDLKDPNPEAKRQSYDIGIYTATPEGSFLN